MSTCLSQGLRNMLCVLVTSLVKSVLWHIGCFWLKLEPATPNMLQQGGQIRGTSCAQQCCTMLHWNVVIIWPGLKRCDWLMVTIIGVEPLIERFRHKLLLGSCVVFLVRTLYYHSTSFYPEISKGFWNKCNKLLFYQKESNHLDVVFRRVLQKLKACRQNPLGRELSCVK